jgi:hypothetical protein
LNRIDAESSPFIVKSARPNNPQSENSQREMKERGMNFGDRVYIEEYTWNSWKVFEGVIMSNQSGDPLVIFDDGRKCAIQLDERVRRLKTGREREIEYKIKTLNEKGIKCVKSALLCPFCKCNIIRIEIGTKFVNTCIHGICKFSSDFEELQKLQSKLGVTA